MRTFAGEGGQVDGSSKQENNYLLLSQRQPPPLPPHYRCCRRFCGLPVVHRHSSSRSTRFLRELGVFHLTRRRLLFEGEVGIAAKLHSTKRAFCFFGAERRRSTSITMSNRKRKHSPPSSHKVGKGRGTRKAERSRGERAREREREMLGLGHKGMTGERVSVGKGSYCRTHDPCAALCTCLYPLPCFGWFANDLQRRAEDDGHMRVRARDRLAAYDTTYTVQRRLGEGTFGRVYECTK